MEPLISVVLPVYNAGNYLKEAIASILKQNYLNYEFIIINDGSTDNSEEVILSFNDNRIKYVYQENKGLGGTLNVGLSLCVGKYIARQDQDDISYPDRFKKQVEFLEKNPKIALLGTHAKIVTENATKISYHRHAASPANLKFDLLFDNPFVHSSVMFRKSAIEANGFYNEDRNLYEDYDLWSRLSYSNEVANLSEVLVEYRHHDKGLSKNFTNFKEYALYNQGIKNIEKLLGTKDDALLDLVALYHWKEEMYKGTSVKKLTEALALISEKIIETYPGERKLVEERKKQYVKIMLYRLNILSRRRNKSNPLKMLLLKLQNKLLGLHPFVINK